MLLRLHSLRYLLLQSFSSVVRLVAGEPAPRHDRNDHCAAAESYPSSPLDLLPAALRHYYWKLGQMYSGAPASSPTEPGSPREHRRQGSKGVFTHSRTASGRSFGGDMLTTSAANISQVRASAHESPTPAFTHSHPSPTCSRGNIPRLILKQYHPSHRALRTSAATKTMHLPQLRNYALLAFLLATLFFLFQSFTGTPVGQISRPTRASLQRWSGYSAQLPVDRMTRITKASAMFGEDNHFYEDALKTHQRHNELHGYGMKILRERITNGYSTKPSYMLSLIVNELTKPLEERAEWLVYMGPDVILLNPHIPLDIFLPPPDFDHIHFLGTHDEEGLNLGVYFMRVNQWSARMLIDVLSYPPDWLGDAAEKDEVAFEMVISSDNFRDHVQYQPRGWWNPYQLTTTTSEAVPGDLLVHFHDLEGDRWTSMAHTLEDVAQPGNPWELSLEATNYELQVAAYWQHLRNADELIKAADAFAENENVLDLVQRLEYAMTYEADEIDSMVSTINGLSLALGVPIKH